MIIKKRRIRTLAANLPTVKVGQNIIIGVKNLDDKKSLLKRIGFESTDEGDVVLPSPVFGSISLFNAEGKYLIHKDKPKETAVRMAEWHWKQWEGRDNTVDMSKFVDVPYKRYPRTFIPPPSIELKISFSTTTEKILITPMHTFGTDNDRLLHTINLLLEIFGECYVYAENLDEILRTETRHLNWKILPEGKIPWQKLRKELTPIISKANEGKRVLIEQRLETINAFEPEFTAVGNAGFSGYIVLGFPVANIYVLESLYYGNATYILGADWETLSKMTKAEILNEKLHESRIIHQVGWDDRMKRLLEVAKLGTIKEN